MRLGLLALLVVLVPALAQAEADRPRSWVSFRVGGAAGPELGGRSEMCLEVSPLAYLSVEGCGNGSGLWHREDAPEVAHFRVKVRVASVRQGQVVLEPQLGLGFAELQLGEDAPGFHFGSTDPTGVETSGLEGTAALRALVPLSSTFEAVAVLSCSLAYLPHAPDLVRPLSSLQPTLGLSIGVGF